MKPIDYIYKNLHCFNLSIFKRILAESGEEVSESIYDYLMETTWNTNPTFLKQFGLDIVRTKEESGTDEEGPMYVIKLGQYGRGMEVYAEDSPWKPTAEELDEELSPLMTSILNDMGYESINDIPQDKMIEILTRMCNEIDNKVFVYSLNGNKLYFIPDGGWVDVSIENLIQDVPSTEYFTNGSGFIEYGSSGDNNSEGGH